MPNGICSGPLENMMPGATTGDVVGCGAAAGDVEGSELGRRAGAAASEGGSTGDGMVTGSRGPGARTIIGAAAAGIGTAVFGMRNGMGRGISVSSRGAGALTADAIGGAAVGGSSKTSGAILKTGKAGASPKAEEGMLIALSDEG